MKLTTQELIDAAQAADAKATAAFTAAGILRWHWDGDEIIDVLQRKGIKKSDQAGRFEARYKARLAALEGELANLESGLTAATIALSEDVP